MAELGSSGLYLKMATPNILTNELVVKINRQIRENHCFTITEVMFQFPQILQNFLHEAVMQKLGYHEFFAR